MARLKKRRAVSLRRALAYPHSDVIARFRKTYPVGLRVAKQLFEDLKRWLWMSAHPDRPSILSIDQRLYALDEMWHMFLVFSRDYREYCNGTLGYFCDHYPTTEADRRAAVRAQRSDPAWSQRGLEQRRLQYEFIRAKLGEDTLRRLYVTYPRTLSQARLQALRLGTGPQQPAPKLTTKHKAGTSSRPHRVARSASSSRAS